MLQNVIAIYRQFFTEFFAPTTNELSAENSREGAKISTINGEIGDLGKKYRLLSGNSQTV